jgi:hypothetical protein
VQACLGQPAPALAAPTLAPTLIGAGRGRDADASWGDESRIAGVEERGGIMALCIMSKCGGGNGPDGF